MKCLADLKIYSIGYIKNINTNKKLKKRLLELGFIISTPIKPVFMNPTKDSRAYEIRGSLIAIRNTDAKNIFLTEDRVLFLNFNLGPGTFLQRK